MIKQIVSLIISKKKLIYIQLIDSVVNVDQVSTHYDDFQTIDWLKDLMRDRFRHRLLRAKTQQSLLNKILMYHDAWSGWLCVLLVGLSAGVIAAVIDIWLNREQCCMYLDRNI
jgi:chloride channel 3/4/5